MEEASTDEAGRPSKRQRPNYADTLVVLVGPKQTKFTVYQEMICASSEFFRAACSGKWKEGQEKTVRLPETVVDDFYAYTHWLLTKKLDLTLAGLSDAMVLVPYSTAAWNLGNFLGNNNFCNSVIDLVLKQSDDQIQLYFSRCALQWAWATAPNGAPIIKLFTDLVLARLGDYEYDEDDLEAMPMSITIQVMKRYARSEGKPGCPTFKDRCNYHEHGEHAQRCT